ncbi:M16 family metallopeptidase [Candidatus Cardinium hertigii]|uniref:Putative zinc protease n=1 Tax=Candidatus Cardinium hertigii TaxID=247481 RepID=A0A2Z3L8E7_9BACT|nr:pitrilysin family protein [Candidatus Cardinium hertigii]AWN81707.1 putative zinc protease [Candidatus Cardinium hertigii]
MISFEKFTLANGLQVVVHEEPNSHIAVVNVLYQVGARDESATQTGFAHLFEHFMFSGSYNIPSYDKPLQQVGGESNAYTTTDITNYYSLLPAVNVETACWLESDRMLGLAFDEKSLEIQKKVVVEEFKEHYLNQPYGDAWHHLMGMAYKVHPYQWPVIGKTVSHIERVTIEAVKDFFYKFYCPSNAVLVIAGKVKQQEIAQLCKKWFEPIPARHAYHRVLPQEPRQWEARRKVIEGAVPFPMLYKAYHMSGKGKKGYYAAEIVRTLLSEGKAALLQVDLVDDQALYTRIECYITDTLDPGLLVISGSPAPSVSLETAESALIATLQKLEAITATELEKAKNQIQAQMVYAQVSIVNRAQDLAMATLLGDTHLVNRSIDYVRAVTLEEVQAVGQEVLQECNCSTLYYQTISTT